MQGIQTENADRAASAISPEQATQRGRRHPESPQDVAASSVVQGITASVLGDSEFKNEYNLKYAYVTGSMYRGISSQAMVVRVAKSGMLGFFGTGGLSLLEIEEAIRGIRKELPNGHVYGMNLLHAVDAPDREENVVDLFLKHAVTLIEASGYLGITSALVRYRAKGLRRVSGRVVINHRIIAKVSRPEIAEFFLAPAPPHFVDKLTLANRITREEAESLAHVPMADDLCVEADSAGHTDGGVAYALLPALINVRDRMMAKHKFARKVRVGTAGGIGTPHAAAAAFVLGADFILTGSINQCTVEAATSDAAKHLLQQVGVQDTDYAPAADMFELGAQVQVVKRGVFFPARAKKLYELYRFCNSLDDVDAKTRKQIEGAYFKRTFEEVYEEAKKFNPPHEVDRAERDPKHKMALVFKWYLGHSAHAALMGLPDCEVDYQIHCGPALGAFNQWVKGSHLESWKSRHVDEIGLKLMTEAATLLNSRFQSLVK